MSNRVKFSCSHRFGPTNNHQFNKVNVQCLFVWFRFCSKRFDFPVTFSKQNHWPSPCILCSLMNLSVYVLFFISTRSAACAQRDILRLTLSYHDLHGCDVCCFCCWFFFMLRFCFCLCYPEKKINCKALRRLHGNTSCHILFHEFGCRVSHICSMTESYDGRMSAVLWQRKISDFQRRAPNTTIQYVIEMFKKPNQIDKPKMNRMLKVLS